MLLLSATLLWTADAASASSRTHGKVIAGWVEKITILPWKHIVKAKLDTGALTSSIDARNVERFVRDGHKWVRFDLEIDTSKGVKKIEKVERRLVRRVLVKQAAGDHDSRLSIELEVCVNGQRRTAEFSLADRKGLIYPVLLGRRFLEGALVVDPSETFLTKATCDEPILPPAAGANGP
jgi:hypothetical protein